MELADSRENLLALVNEAFEGMAIWEGPPWRLSFANRTFCQWLSRDTQSLMGSTLPAIFDTQSCSELAATMDSACAAERGIETIATLQGDGDEACRVELRVCCVKVAGRPMVGMVLRRITAAEPADAARARRHDPLTNLPDREFLLRRMAELLRGDRRADQQFAVLFIDLDNFKQVNDEYGHLIGDSVLREAARRLAGCVREGDHVARYGGDEFVVLLEGIANEDAIGPVADRICTALARPIALPHGEVTLSLSLGSSLAAAEHQLPEDVLAAADRAMYAAKRARS